MIFWIELSKKYWFHFNFSTTKSLLFFLFCPKYFGRWSLMLHHGNLHPFINRYITKICLKRFDAIHALGIKQLDFYVSMGFPIDRIDLTSSYVPAEIVELKTDDKIEINNFFSSRATIVASGYPASIYNHVWSINYAKEREHFSLALFIYGRGDDIDEIVRAAMGCKRIKIYFDSDENFFNYALSKAFCYIRPNMTDSFGIAVADAVSFGVPAIASNVCRRYPGTKIIDLCNYEDFCNKLDGFFSGTKIIDTAFDCDFVNFSYKNIIKYRE